MTKKHVFIESVYQSGPRKETPPKSNQQISV